MKKKCTGTGKLPVVITREEWPDLLPGCVAHCCPVCGRGWARNTLQDWSQLPIPIHYKKGDRNEHI